MIRYCKVDGIEGVCIFHHVVVSYFLTEDIMVVVEEPCGGLSCVELHEVKMIPPLAANPPANTADCAGKEGE